METFTIDSSILENGTGIFNAYKSLLLNISWLLTCFGLG
jgi:hypothetical protein